MVLNQSQVTYALEQLITRAGLIGSFENENFQKNPVEIRYQKYDQDNLELDKKVIYINPANSDSWASLLKTEPGQIAWVKSEVLLPPGLRLGISENIPILFPSYSSPEEKIVQIKNDREVVLNFDFAAATFFMLSRYEELVNPARDKYGRFPAHESIAYKQGFLVQPIVDELALILRAWIKYLVPEWKPIVQKPALLLTHDIDFIRTLPNLRKVVRALLTTVKTDGVINAAKNIRHTYEQEKNDLLNSPYFQNISKLIEYSTQQKTNSLFFFKSGNASFYDSGYDVETPALKVIFNQIQEAGFEIGLHPGFNSFKSSRRIRNEKIRLEKAVGRQASKCRQHYLRFDPRVTWKCQQEAGFSYDHTLAYAEHEGFRCGTCHPFRPFDFNESKPYDLIEIPLIVMDSTLRDYQNYSVHQAESKILDLAKKCFAVEGTFTLLWHNTSISGNWTEWGNMYRDLLPKLKANCH